MKTIIKKMKGFLIMLGWAIFWFCVCLSAASCTVTVNPDGSRQYTPDPVFTDQLITHYIAYPKAQPVIPEK